ncbi:hypothetical protein BJX99DRAFT_228219 [Aspergillus californicus]
MGKTWYLFFLSFLFYSFYSILFYSSLPVWKEYRVLPSHAPAAERVHSEIGNAYVRSTRVRIIGWVLEKMLVHMQGVIIDPGFRFHVTGWRHNELGS